MKTILGLFLVGIASTLTAQDSSLGPFANEPRMRILAARACGGASSIACGNTKTGALTTDDCVYSDKSYYDLWTFAGVAGQTVTINMNSTVFDTYLDLFDASGAHLAANDDTLTTNSQITYKITANGTYQIGASSSKSATTGSYSLLLSCADSGTPNLVPYKLADWSDKIILTRASDSAVDATNLTSGETFFIKYAVLNSGTGVVDDLTTRTALYLDGSQIGYGLPGTSWPNNYYWWWYHLTGPLSAGVHTVSVRADDNQVVPESNEADNQYTRTFSVAGAATGICTRTATMACLNNRFGVTVQWIANNTAGVGTPQAITTDSAWFWFFGATAAELMVKVVDGRAVNGRFWFFAGGLTNADVTISVTDSSTGAVKSYHNPSGTAFLPIQDTTAF